MERHLAGRGVTGLQRIPLGVDRLFFAAEHEPANASEARAAASSRRVGGCSSWAD